MIGRHVYHHNIPGSLGDGFRRAATLLAFDLSGTDRDGLLAGMFRVLQWFLLIGAFAGLGLRASGAHLDTCPPAAHEVSCCDEEGAPDAGHEVHHCPDCPPTPHQHGPHHHHGECCHLLQAVPPALSDSALFPPWAVKSGLRLSEERPPEAPVLSLDKPPLI